MNKVQVTADEAGAVVRVSKNPEFGVIRVEETSVSHGADGWARKTTKSALIKGTVSDLKEFGYSNGQKISGQVVIVESLEPTNPSNLEQDAKIAGDSGVPCTLGGAQIYRTGLYTTNPEATDTLIAHDNSEAIKSAQAELAGANESANLD